MDIADIQAEINSIPAKKEELRKAFEELQSYSSSFSSFPLKWKDFDDYISSFEKSIKQKLQKLKADASPANVSKDQENPVIVPRPELKFPCINMNANALRLYVMANSQSTEAIRMELRAALLSSPDPVTLVLDSCNGFVQSPAIRRACLTIVEALHGLNLEIKALQKERAREMAKECSVFITDGNGDNEVVVLLFLQLASAFGLLEFFPIHHFLDVLLLAAEKNDIVDLFRNSAFKAILPDFIQKLNGMGRQLDSVKLVVAFDDLKRKHPLPFLFKSYLKKVKEMHLHRGLASGCDSFELRIEAIQKQIASVEAVMEAVEMHRVDSEYAAGLLKCMGKLMKQKMELERKKEMGSTYHPSNHKKRKQPSRTKRMTSYKELPNKRPWPLNSAPAPAVSHPQNPHAGGSIISAAGGLSFGSRAPLPFNALRPPPPLYFYPPRPFPGVIYRPFPYRSHAIPAFPLSYKPPPYP